MSFFPPCRKRGCDGDLVPILAPTPTGHKVYWVCTNCARIVPEMPKR